MVVKNKHENKMILTTLTSRTFTNLDFEKSKFIYGKNYTKCDFNGIYIRGTIFSECEFIECSFDGANFFDATFEDCTFVECSFNKIFSTDGNFSGGKIKKCTFNFASRSNNLAFSEVTLSQCMLIHSGNEQDLILFEKCNLYSVYFIESSIIGFSFNTCKLFNALFDKTTIKETEFFNTFFNECLFKSSSFDRMVFNSCCLKKSAFENCSIDKTTKINNVVFIDTTVKSTTFPLNTLSSIKVEPIIDSAMCSMPITTHISNSVIKKEQKIKLLKTAYKFITPGVC